MINSILSIFLGIVFFFIIFYSVVYTKEKFSITPTDYKLEDLKKKIEIILNKDNYFTGSLSPLNNRDFLNEINIYPGKKSYTINKKDTYICMKDKKSGEYYDDNILMYVLIHELAHSINTKNIGHTKEFHEINNELLKLATEEGIYDPSVNIPLNYCK